MAKLGYVTLIGGLGMQTYVTNLSYNELYLLSVTESDSMPKHALIICAYNNSTSESVQEDESYRIAATDHQGNLCPLTQFDLFGNGIGTVTEGETTKLLVKLGNGLTFDKNGNITLKLATDSGLKLTSNGLSLMGE